MADKEPKFTATFASQHEPPLRLHATIRHRDGKVKLLVSDGDFGKRWWMTCGEPSADDMARVVAELKASQNASNANCGDCGRETE